MQKYLRLMKCVIHVLRCFTDKWHKIWTLAEIQNITFLGIKGTSRTNTETSSKLWNVQEGVSWSGLQDTWQWKMNSNLYQGILEDDVRAAVRDLKHRKGWVRQRDDDPKLTNSTNGWLKKKKIHLLELKSPNLNPAEMLWHHMHCLF